MARTWSKIAGAALALSFSGCAMNAVGPSLSRFALTDRAWFGESDRHLGVIGVGEVEHIGVTGLVRPN